MPAVGEVRALVEAFDPGRDEQATRSRALVLALLARSPPPFSRDQYTPGHLTASGIVLSPDRGSILLVYHRRLARWLQPGGHIEPQDATVAGAARREILEETGVPVDEVTAVVVGVDVHVIPAARGEPEHCHHDIAFRFAAATMALPATGERNEVRWCPVGELGRCAVDPPLQRSVERAIRQKE